MSGRSMLNLSSRGIGPGRLVLVVGPSGAGKDTLIGAARARCAGNDAVVFPRRVVTRESSAAEDHDTLSEPDFDRAVRDGAFALWWAAHGLKYGVPVSIDREIVAGRTAVCNVSRTAVAAARERYAHCVVVLVTVPAHIRIERLSARNRSSDGDLQARLIRDRAVDLGIGPDVVIDNSGPIDRGARKLLDTIHPNIAAVRL